MTESKNVDAFLSQYDQQVFTNALSLREVLFANLPGVIELIDFPAKMIAYCYGQKYAEMICTIIPSNKGLTDECFDLNLTVKLRTFKRT
jgi:hypothetical protein